MRAPIARHHDLLAEQSTATAACGRRSKERATRSSLPSPDRPTRCARRALVLVREPWPTAKPITVRIAVHTGEAQLRRRRQLRRAGDHPHGPTASAWSRRAGARLGSDPRPRRRSGGHGLRSAGARRASSPMPANKRWKHRSLGATTCSTTPSERCCGASPCSPAAGHWKPPRAYARTMSSTSSRCSDSLDRLVEHSLVQADDTPLGTRFACSKPSANSPTVYSPITRSTHQRPRPPRPLVRRVPRRRGSPTSDERAARPASGDRRPNATTLLAALPRTRRNRRLRAAHPRRWRRVRGDLRCRAAVRNGTVG